MGFGRASSSDSDMCSLPGVLRRHDVHARSERSVPKTHVFCSSYFLFCKQRCGCRSNAPKTRRGSQQAPCIRALAVYMVPRPDAVQQQVVAVVRVHTREEVVVPATTWCITLVETSLSPRPRGTNSPRGHRSKTHVGLTARTQTCRFEFQRATRGQRGPREAAQPSLSSPNRRFRDMRIAGRNTVSPNLCAVHTQSHGDTW